MKSKNSGKKISRRDFLRFGIGSLSIITIFGLSFKSILKITVKDKTVWQIDPYKCIQCGKCSTSCILNPSSVKCIHSFNMCGYCDLCSGYFKPKSKELTTGAEYQMCPMKAIKRKFIEDPYYEYTIDESLCIGCGKCVTGCNDFGNGSLQLQIKHDRCLNCNECSIAKNCPAGAVVRISEKRPYLIKGDKKDA